MYFSIVLHQYVVGYTSRVQSWSYPEKFTDNHPSVLLYRSDSILMGGGGNTAEVVDEASQISSDGNITVDPPSGQAP